MRSLDFFPFLCKPGPSAVTLESPRLENILQVFRNRAKIGQNHDARKAVSTTLLVLKWSGGIFRPKSSKPRVRSFYLCPFLWKSKPPGVTLKSLGHENIPQGPANWAKVGQNHDARKAVSAILLVSTWSGAIFRPISSKPRVRSFYLCPFLCKPRPSAVCL